MNYKGLVALGIAFLSVAGGVSAQSLSLSPKERFVFGLKAGINRSNVWDAKGQDFKADAVTGFAGGAFFSLPISRFIGVQPEVLVSQKGYQSTGTFLGNFYYNSRTTTFIDVPILFALKPSPFFTVLAGPQYSYLVNQKDETRFGANSTATEQQFNNDNVRKNIFGFEAGLDINIKHVVISGRGGWDITHNNGDGTATTPRYRNNWMQLTLGFRI